MQSAGIFEGGTKVIVKTSGNKLLKAFFAVFRTITYRNVKKF